MYPHFLTQMYLETHTHTCTRTLTHTHTHTHTHKHAHTHTHTHARTHAHTQTHTHTHAHTHMRTQTHTHTHTPHTHTHTHTQVTHVHAHTRTRGVPCTSGLVFVFLNVCFGLPQLQVPKPYACKLAQGQWWQRWSGGQLAIPKSMLEAHKPVHSSSIRHKH